MPRVATYPTDSRVRALRARQDEHTIEDILRSQKSVKNIAVSVRAEWFGLAWASGPNNDFDTYTGKITGWKKKEIGALYVKWEGWDRARDTRLARRGTSRWVPESRRRWALHGLTVV